jgi:hypothetical protein
MCNPYLFGCSATHFPLVIDGALEHLNKSRGKEVHLSQGAQDALYEYGSAHKEKFERALKDQNPKRLEELSKGLSQRLETALSRSKQIDPQGHPYNPARIDGKKLKEVLQESPWEPEP